MSSQYAAERLGLALLCAGFALLGGVARAEPGSTASFPPLPAPALRSPEIGAPQPEPMPRAREPARVPRVESAPASPASGARRDPELDQSAAPGARAGRARPERWLFGVEAVTHAPVDVGINAELELPFGLRLSGGYAWVPGAYRNLIADVATLGIDTSSGAGALVRRGWQSGRTWRIAVGIRPFKNTGVYLDGGYSEVRLSGAFDSSVLGVPAAEAAQYSVHSTLNMWLVELGYETMIADRVVLGIGIGVMGTFGASTTATPLSGVEASTPLVGDAARGLDRQIERYGFIPTLSARLGFNLI